MSAEELVEEKEEGTPVDTQDFLDDLLGEPEGEKEEEEESAAEPEPEPEEDDEEESEQDEQEPTVEPGEDGEDGEEESEEAEETPEEAPEEAPTVESLQAQIAELKALAGQGIDISTLELEDGDEQEAAPSAADALQYPEFTLTDKQVEEIEEDPRSLGPIIQHFVTEAVAVGEQKAVVQIGSIVDRQMRARATIGTFFAHPENADLIPHTEQVKQLCLKIEADHPDMTPTAILKHAGKLYREKVLQAGSSTPKKAKKAKKPKAKRIFAGGTRRRGVAQRKSSKVKNSASALADELDEMANL